MPDRNLLWIAEKLFDFVQKPHGTCVIRSLRFRYREMIRAELREEGDWQFLAVFTLLPYFFGSLPCLCHTFTPIVCSCACISRRVRMQVSKTADHSSEKQLLKVSVCCGFVAVCFGFGYKSCEIGAVLFLEKRVSGWYNGITKRKRRRVYEAGKRSP